MDRDVEESEIGIYDAPPDGIDLVVPIAEGVDVTFHMSDEQAEFVVETIQNKLNGRWK